MTTQYTIHDLIQSERAVIATLERWRFDIDIIDDEPVFEDGTFAYTLEDGCTVYAFKDNDGNYICEL